MYTPYFIRSTLTKKITLEIQRILSCLISHFLSLFTQARDARIIVGLFSEEKAVEVFCQVTVGEWDFRFYGFGYFSDRFFRSLCQKTAVFRFCRVVTVVFWWFSVLKHLVFGICKKKKKTGLRIWCPMWFSVFPIWVLVALRSEQQLYHWFKIAAKPLYAPLH